MRVYCDTSALVAAYVSEALTPQVVARLAKPDTICVSWLTRVEFCSALALKTRTGDLDEEAARRVLAMFERHLNTKAYKSTNLPTETGRGGAQSPAKRAQWRCKAKARGMGWFNVSARPAGERFTGCRQNSQGPKGPKGLQGRRRLPGFLCSCP